MRKRRISFGKQAKLIERFVAGITVRTASRLRVNKTKAAYYFTGCANYSIKLSPIQGHWLGEIEVDESYFGGPANVNVGGARPARCGVWPV
jgi:transposase-like protein